MVNYFYDVYTVNVLLADPKGYYSKWNGEGTEGVTIKGAGSSVLLDFDKFPNEAITAPGNKPIYKRPTVGEGIYLSSEDIGGEGGVTVGEGTSNPFGPSGIAVAFYKGKDLVEGQYYDKYYFDNENAPNYAYPRNYLEFLERHSNNFGKRKVVKGAKIRTVEAEDGKYPSNGIYNGEWYVRTTSANLPPTLKLETLDGQTFFEGDNLVIHGVAHDKDKGDVIVIKAKLADSATLNLSTRISDGEPFDFSQTLVFKQGRFMRGNEPVTGVLKEGDSYSLQVWAEDNKGAKSNIEKRVFGSVPNRPPIVNVTKTPSFTNASRTQIMSIEGTATDPDGDKVTVTIKHDSKPIITLPLANSKWSHTFLPGDLNVGANTFVITATDDKGLSHTKTVRINNKKYVSDMTHVPLVSLLDVDLEGVESDGGLLWIRRASDKTEYSARISTTDKKDASFIVADKASHIVNGMPRDQFTGETGVKSKRVTFEVTAKGAGSVTMIQGVVK